MEKKQAGQEKTRTPKASLEVSMPKAPKTRRQKAAQKRRPAGHRAAKAKRHDSQSPTHRLDSARSRPLRRGAARPPIGVVPCGAGRPGRARTPLAGAASIARPASGRARAERATASFGPSPPRSATDRKARAATAERPRQTKSRPSKNKPWNAKRNAQLVARRERKLWTKIIRRVTQKPEPGLESSITVDELRRPKYRVCLPGKAPTWERWPMAMPEF